MSEKKGKQGFASMNKDRLKEISILGGKKSQESGKAHRFTPEEAKLASALGHQKVKAKLEEENAANI